MINIHISTFNNTSSDFRGEFPIPTQGEKSLNTCLPVLTSFIPQSVGFRYWSLVKQFYFAVDIPNEYSYVA